MLGPIRLRRLPALAVVAAVMWGRSAAQPPGILDFCVRDQLALTCPEPSKPQKWVRGSIPVAMDYHDKEDGYVTTEHFVNVKGGGGGHEGTLRRILLSLPERHERHYRKASTLLRGEEHSPRPVLFVFHGLDCKCEDQLPMLGAPARARGAAIIAPCALPMAVCPDFLIPSWNYGVCCNDVDDVAFFDAIVRDFLPKLKPHTGVTAASPLFAYGHSSGAFFVQRLVCERSEVISKAISKAGSMQLACSAAEGSRICDSHYLSGKKGRGNVALFMAHGRADTEVPFDGRSGFQGLPAEELGELANDAQWAVRNGCASSPTREVLNASAGYVRLRWPGCKAGAEVSLLESPTDPHRFTEAFEAVFRREAEDFLFGPAEEDERQHRPADPRPAEEDERQHQPADPRLQAELEEARAEAGRLERELQKLREEHRRESRLKDEEVRLGREDEQREFMARDTEYRQQVEDGGKGRVLEV